MRELVIAAALFAIAAPAAAVDPECESPAADQTIWHLEDGDGRFCTPHETVSGQPLPETGYPITCDVSVDGLVYLTFEGLGPGVPVTVVQGPYRFAHPVAISCVNGVGGAGVVVADGRFPPEAVGRPALLVD